MQKPARRPTANSRPERASKLRVALFGTSDFAVPALRALAREHDVMLAVTQPDRPSGRGLRVAPTPVKTAALALAIPVVTPARLDAATVEQIKSLRLDALVCVSYGKILPAALLTDPVTAALNIHPSALPKYRGATPIHAALLAGDETTAITIIWMSDRLDAGDIACQIATRIEAGENFGALHDRLAAESAPILVTALASLADGTLPRLPQDESRATYTKPIVKSDLELQFDRGAVELARQVRAFAPKPGAWMRHAGLRLKVLEAQPDGEAVEAQPGSVMRARDGGALVRTAEGSLRLVEVVPEGKRPMSGDQFARGLRG